MKRFFTTVFFGTVFYLQGRVYQLDLQEAIDKKLVTASAKSLGGYQGLCASMELKNLSKDSLRIVIEAGRRLDAKNDNSQDLLITHELPVLLGAFEKRSVAVTAYCCQYGKASPGKDAAYLPGRLADNNLVRLAQYLNIRKTDLHTEQQAIWAISDNKPVSLIASLNDSLCTDLKRLVCDLKGEPLPWYSLICATIVYQSGAMATQVLWLRGKLNFSCGQTCYTTLHVINDKGMEVCQCIQQWTQAGAAQAYDLNLPVKGLPKGKYIVELKTPEKQLAQQGFEI